MLGTFPASRVWCHIKILDCSEKGRQQAPVKPWDLCTNLHDITLQETEIFIRMDLKTTNFVMYQVLNNSSVPRFELFG